MTVRTRSSFSPRAVATVFLGAAGNRIAGNRRRANKRAAAVRASRMWKASGPIIPSGGADDRLRRLRWQGRKSTRFHAGLPCRKWSAFYAIAEFSELLDHARGARACGLGTHRGTPFLVADRLMENQPKQSALSMSYGPDGLFVFQARRQ